MSLFQRVALAGLALLLLGLLITAGSLTPEEHGYGTHQQLGLPPCTFYLIFHRPCPACGMTTSWAWLLRGAIGNALAANAGGTLLAGLSLAGVPWLTLSALRGRWPKGWLGGRPRESDLIWIVGIVSLVTAGQWVWRLWTF
jgi:hypothetical protein